MSQPDPIPLPPANTPEPPQPSPPEDPTPMLDVHPPHHAANSWRDFFVHIATIVLGLLIAIGLEQAVEYIHHRHQVADTRDALREEKQENIRRFHQNVEKHIMTMAYLHNNLRIFEYLRDHPGTPQEKLPGILYWPIFSEPPQEAAWDTAERTEVLSLMPRAEVSEIAATYKSLEYAWQSYQPVIDLLKHSTAYYADRPDISTFSPSEVTAEIDLIKQTFADEAAYGDTLSLQGRQPEFGPVPSWWQMLPFFTMQDYYKWAATHPELNAPSQKDIDQARTHAGLPPEPPNQSFHEFTKPTPRGTDIQGTDIKQ